MRTIKIMGWKQSRAFALIEFLVMAGVIALLAVLLLPTLTQLKGKGQRARCLDNMRQLMLATQLYAVDFNGYLPYCGAGTIPLCHSNCWAYARDSSGYYPERGQLWPYHQSLAVLMCPLEDTNAPYFKPRFTYGYETVTSYNFSTSAAGFAGPTERSGPNSWNKGVGLKLNLFRADDILAWEPPENIPFGFNDAAVEPWELCSARHDGGNIVGCYGGGAEYMKFRAFVEAEKKKPGRLYCKPNSPDGT